MFAFSDFSKITETDDSSNSVDLVDVFFAQINHLLAVNEHLFNVEEARSRVLGVSVAFTLGYLQILLRNDFLFCLGLGQLENALTHLNN